MKKSVKWLLFISSYIPLFVILIVDNIDIDSTFTSFNYVLTGNISSAFKLIVFQDVYLWFLISLCILSLSILILVIRQSHGFTNPKRVKNIETDNKAILEYFVSYILALNNSSFNIRDILIFWIVFLIIGYLYIKNNMFYVNPTLHLLFGYNIYKITYETNNRKSTNEGFVISKLSDYAFASYADTVLDLIPLSEGLGNNIFLFK